MNVVNEVGKKKYEKFPNLHFELQVDESTTKINNKRIRYFIA